jgi:hypothetical protein
VIRLAALLVVAIGAGLRAAPAIPERLSDTGLFLAGTTSVDPANRPFSPQYPLWTDGARKSRWIQLPPGARIDATDLDNWSFPPGTRLWKEFAFGGRRVETRLLWRTNSGAWAYATYVWNDAQTDAILAPADGLRGVAEVEDGKRHSIPSRDDCRACHENGRTPVLGFTALQLSDDRDAAAPNAEPPAGGMLTLRRLLDERLLDPARPELASTPPRIPGDSSTRAALGYLTANCGHCHNEESSLATVRMPLRMPAYPSDAHVDATVKTLLAHTTKWDLPHAAPGTTRAVAAGAPGLSALFVRMQSRRPSSQMPPLGTVVPDREALKLVAGWIQSLARD